MLKQSLKEGQEYLREMEIKVLEKGYELKKKKMELETLQGSEGECGKLENLQLQFQNKIQIAKLRLKIHMIEEQLSKLERAYICKKKQVYRSSSMTEQELMDEMNVLLEEQQISTPSVFYPKQQPTVEEPKSIRHVKDMNQEKKRYLDEYALGACGSLNRNGGRVQNLKTVSTPNRVETATRVSCYNNGQDIHKQEKEKVSSYAQADYLQCPSYNSPKQNISKTFATHQNHTFTDGMPGIRDQDASSITIKYVHESEAYLAKAKCSHFYGKGYHTQVDKGTKLMKSSEKNPSTVHCVHKSAEYTPVLTFDSPLESLAPHSEYSNGGVGDERKNQYYSEVHDDFCDDICGIRPMCFKSSGVINDISVIYHGSNDKRGKVVNDDLKIEDLD